jgi:predicted nucleic acid-binding protein
MSLADACLVSMAERYPSDTVMTLDHDFLVYRKHGRQAIPTRMPTGL